VAEYQDRFQALLPRAGPLLEEQRVQLFTGGLQPPLSIDARIQNPQSLAAAMSLARQFELCEQYTAPASRAPGRPLLQAPPARLTLAAPPAAKPVAPATITVEGRAIKRLSQTEQEHRRLGLCYNCDEKFTRGHNRICKRLFLLEGIEEDDDGAAGEAAEDAGNEETPVFSLQALAGVALADTMQLQVALGAASLVAMLDSGSTHNFISEAAAARTGLPLQNRPRLTAMVANGERVACVGVIRAAPLDIDGHRFPADLYVMPLAGYDVVLGTRWLAALGPIVWDFSNHAVSFTLQDRAFCWQGLAASRPTTVSTTTATNTLLTELLGDFDDVFGEPRGLPPPRSRDHSITLLPGAPPVAVRPYRYPNLHKNELERQCTVMLEQGLIQPSSSAFSSPVLLVKKLDGSWRFCVDYRALNAITVKDTFPIPVVDDLLDELHGARFFTKLDLRSGYHQVRMRPADIDKTAFRTHDAFFEFLVMPFGLCNAQATFQALMNDVLRPYLCRFVLVFFDDILIYSSSWADHLRHLRVVLSVLRQHSLFVKRSKCAFGMDTVAYLGNTISASGVAMDPAKV
jgi:hypothetical protein